jgi:oligosaccharide repeat unit polymerase
MFEFRKYKSVIDVVWYATIIFVIFNFKFENDFAFVLSELCFVAYLLYILSILRSKIFKHIYEPPIFFLFFSFIYEFLKFPYYFKYTTVNAINAASELGTPRYKVPDYFSNSALLLLYQIICITVLMYVYQLLKKPAKPKPYKPVTILGENYLLGVCILFLIAGAIGLYQITGGNLLFLLTRRAGNEEAGKILKDNFFVAFSPIFVLICVPILIGIKVFSQKPWKRLLIIYIPAMVLEYIVSGGRGFIIYSIATTFIIISSQKGFSFSVVRLSLIGGTVVLLFSFLGLIRRSFTDTKNILDNLKSRSEVEDQWYYEITSYQLQLRDEMVFANASRFGFVLGGTYSNLIFFMFPRSVIGDSKPEFLDLQVSEDFWNRNDLGLPLNAMGESYFNFSYFGILVFVLLGALMARLYSWLSNSRYIFVKIVGIVLLFYAQTWASTFVLYSIEFLIVMYFPLKAVKERATETYSTDEEMITEAVQTA